MKLLPNKFLLVVRKFLFQNYTLVAVLRFVYTFETDSERGQGITWSCKLGSSCSSKYTTNRLRIWSFIGSPRLSEPFPQVWKWLLAEFLQPLNYQRVNFNACCTFYLSILSIGISFHGWVAVSVQITKQSVRSPSMWILFPATALEWFLMLRGPRGIRVCVGSSTLQ